MTLLPEDGKLYYKLWRPLLDYVNKKHHINDLKNIAAAQGLDPAKVKEVADKLWADVSIIDDYLKEPAIRELPEEDKEIVSGWKRCIQGRFIMERHLKKGTIFISMDTEEVYQVMGIVSSWEEMFFGVPMPLIVEATFIPFRNVIISDGLVMSYNIIVGGGIKKMFKDVYMNAKQNGSIHHSL